MGIDIGMRLGELLGLGRRLLAVSPGKWDEALARFRGFVEGQEVLAEADRLLILRGKRPAKKYAA